MSATVSYVQVYRMVAGSDRGVAAAHLAHGTIISSYRNWAPRKDRRYALVRRLWSYGHIEGCGRCPLPGPWYDDISMFATGRHVDVERGLHELGVLLDDARHVTPPLHNVPLYPAMHGAECLLTS